MSSANHNPPKTFQSILFLAVPTYGPTQLKTYTVWPDENNKVLLKSVLFRICFKIFDTDGDGFITRAELRRAMDTIGEKLTEEELDDILRQTDADRDGRIDYQGTTSN